MKKYYDLSSAQQLLFYSQTFTLHKQVNNICTSVLVDKELDLNIIKQAIEIACERNDSFRLRLTKIDKVVKQYFEEYEKPSIEYLDFRGASFDEMEKRLYKIARKRITYLEKPLYKIYTMHSYNGKCGLFFVVSHLMIDSWAITTFFKDVLAIYNAISEGMEMPKPLVPYEELLIKELNYKNTETYKSDRKFWEEYFEEPEPIYTHVNGYKVLEDFRRKKKNPNIRYGNGFILRTKAKIVMLPFSKEIVNKMEGYCRENRSSMQSLVLLAYRSFLSKVNRREKDIAMLTVVARRGTLKEKNSGGTRAHGMLFRTIIEEDTSFKEACAYINERQIITYRHSEINTFEVIEIMQEKYNLSKTLTYFASTITFQPVSLNTGEGMNIETKWYGNGTASQPIYLTVMDGDGSGGLKFYYEYHTSIISYERIQELHSYIMRFIEAGVNNPELSIGDLLDLEESQQSLKI